MCFQMTFAIITPALICGAFADRMKFSALLWFIGLWAVLVYAPIAHWVWGPDGFLKCRGARFCRRHGGAHQCRRRRADGGAGDGQAARLRHRADAAAQSRAQRDRRLAAVGRLVRLQCRLGGGGQRQCRHGDGGNPDRDGDGGAGLDVRRVVVKGKPSVLGIISGAVAGLVAITPASGFVDPRGALIIGIAAGVVCYWGATGLKHARL